MSKNSVKSKIYIPFQNPFWSSLHHQKVIAFSSLFMNWNLVLVGGIKRDFSNLFVFASESQSVAEWQFGTFQKSSFRSITIYFSLQNGITHICCILFEFGSTGEKINIGNICSGCSSFLEKILISNCVITQLSTKLG